MAGAANGAARDGGGAGVSLTDAEREQLGELASVLDDDADSLGPGPDAPGRGNHARSASNGQFIARGGPTAPAGPRSAPKVTLGRRPGPTRSHHAAPKAPAGPSALQIHSAAWQSGAAMLAAWRGPHWTISDDESKLLAQASIPLSKLGKGVELPDWLAPIVATLAQLLAPLALVGALVLAARIVAQPRLEYEAARRAEKPSDRSTGGAGMTPPRAGGGGLRPLSRQAPVNGHAEPEPGPLGLDLGDG